MADIDLQLKAIDALACIRTAIKNVQLYPSVDPAITNSIETLYLHFLETLRQDAPSVFAQLEKKYLPGENISNQQENETIHISSLLDILLALGIKGVSFDKDMEKEELHIFINLLARNPKPVQDEVDLPRLAAENEPANIDPADIEYVTLEKDQEIISEPDVAENQISESIDRVEKIFTRMNAMEGAIEAIPSDEKMEMIKRLSAQAEEWVERETIFTPEYKEICQRLQSLLQDFIGNGFFAEAKPIINVFSKINNGTLKKDDEIRNVSLDVIRNLASDNNINILYKEISVNERNKKFEASQIFAGFGDIVINKLLNGLRNAVDSKVRISIIHIIGEMGPAAIPAVKASINMNSPWYYLRNMAYILGRIGNETSADILKPLLLHKEKRVRMEAFKSIGQTGGNMRGPVLLSVLPQADQELRVNIIEMLGKIKYAEAVTDLQDMLKSKSSMAKDDLISLQEKICKALGVIGSPEAIKALSEVAEAKSILGIGSYSKEVKYAAERALAYVRKK
jgi:hypothetical protein